jgi:putative ATP-dependent endonuclease of OLD family
LVHSHNNERLFFADRVVLVEGITDRLVLENLVGRVGRWVATRETVEVIEVHGKHNFGYYRQILQEVETPILIIADLDYMIQRGSAAVKELFLVNHQAIDQKVLLDKKSRDRSTLIEKIEEACITGQLDQLFAIITHIKERCRALKQDLNEAEQALLDKELARGLQESVLIWRRGEIEDYLPRGVRSVGEVIELLADDDLLHRLDPDIGNELVEVACWVLQLDSHCTASAKRRFVDVKEVEHASD